MNIEDRQKKTLDKMVELGLSQNQSRRLIGTCSDCIHWEVKTEDGVIGVCKLLHSESPHMFGCIHWEAKDG